MLSLLLRFCLFRALSSTHYFSNQPDQEDRQLESSAAVFDRSRAGGRVSGFVHVVGKLTARCRIGRYAGALDTSRA